jgi:hypothetical protein
LPAYMVPAAYVQLEALPLTPNGKVDRKALPTPESTAYATRDYVAPRTHVEAVLADLWGEVLGQERVSVEAHFFQQGGHSLLATRIVGKAAKLFRTQLSLRDFFDNPTVAGYARVIVAAGAKPGQAETIASLMEQIKSLTPEEVGRRRDQALLHRTREPQ